MNFFANFNLESLIFPTSSRLALPVVPAPSISIDSRVSALQAAAKLAQFLVNSSSPGKPRIVVMNAESTVLDLMLCIESNPAAKLEKRVRRMQTLLKFFGSEMSHETLQRVDRIVELIENSGPAEAIEKPTDAQLYAELQASVVVDPTDAVDGLIFDKPVLGGEFKTPVKQPFHDSCKAAVNCDGEVYDIFTAVAIIAFETLLYNNISKCPIRASLLSKVKLAFKGGAAAGKFLFMSNTKLWESMTEIDRKLVKTNFIDTGDNDTGLVFTRPDDLGCSTAAANDVIGQVLFDMNKIVLEVVRRFHVEDIINSYMQSHLGTEFEFAGRQFAFEARTASSFAITEKNAEQNEILVLEQESHQLFTSMSLIEFQSANGGLTKFYLSRVKAAFVARDADGLAVNCYAECLDISAACLNSAKVASEYQHATYRP